MGPTTSRVAVPSPAPRSRTEPRSHRVAGHDVALPANVTAPLPGSVAGRYRCSPGGQHWWWSAELFALHGLPADSAVPSAELLLERVHRDDRPRVRDALFQALRAGRPFAVQHRVVRADGSERTAVLFGEPEQLSPGDLPAVTGLVIDVTDDSPARSAGAEVLALETEVEQLRTAMTSRATIEQAKGVLMLLMGCGEQVAFDLLAHISSHTHRKVRDVATALVASASGRTPLPADVKSILHDACPPEQAPH